MGWKSAQYKTKKHRIRLFCLGVALVALCGCVTSNDTMQYLVKQSTDLEESQKEVLARMTELENQVVKDQENQRAQNDSVRDQVAKMRAESEALSMDVRGLVGQLEETGFVLNQKVGDMEDERRKKEEALENVEQSLEKMSTRLERLELFLGMEEAKPGAAPAAAAAVAVAVAVEAPPEKPREPATESEAYDQAKKSFDRGELETARTQFNRFLERFPQSKNADNALFWIGETYFQEKWYEKAIVEYQKVIENHPKGNKVPAALLKQGMAFSRLEDNQNARHIYNELARKFPNTPEALLADKKLKALPAP